MATEQVISFEQLVAEAELQDLCGWDFSYIGSRWRESPVSWDYRQRVLGHLGQRI